MTQTNRLKNMVAELMMETRGMARLDVLAARDLLVLSECISACLTGFLLRHRDYVPPDEWSISTVL